MNKIIKVINWYDPLQPGLSLNNWSIGSGWPHNPTQIQPTNSRFKPTSQLDKYMDWVWVEFILVTQPTNLIHDTSNSNSKPRIQEIRVQADISYQINKRVGSGWACVHNS